MDDVETTLTIPGALFKRIEERAIEDRTSPSQVIINALVEYLPAPLERDFAFGMPRKTRRE